MWVVYAFAAALFAGLTSILAKIGIRRTDSNVATAIRTIVVLVFSLLMVGVVGSSGEIAMVGGRSWLFLVLSGLATGASWLCYFRALKLGEASRVAPIDKLSVVLVAVFGVVFLGERLAAINWLGVLFITAGVLMVAYKP